MDSAVRGAEAWRGRKEEWGLSICTVSERFAIPRVLGNAVGALAGSRGCGSDGPEPQGNCLTIWVPKTGHVLSGDALLHWSRHLWAQNLHQTIDFGQGATRAKVPIN
jgi:hypothetical protein